MWVTISFVSLIIACPLYWYAIAQNALLLRIPKASTTSCILFIQNLLESATAQLTLIPSWLFKAVAQTCYLRAIPVTSEATPHLFFNTFVSIPVSMFVSAAIVPSAIPVSLCFLLKFISPYLEYPMLIDDEWCTVSIKDYNWGIFKVNVYLC